jgi:hypothetical protein
LESYTLCWPERRHKVQIGIYLAGAMRFSSSEDEDYDRGWRRVVAKEMERFSSRVNVYDPMFDEGFYRGKAKLFDKFVLEPNSLLHQDMARILRSDIIFMNLLPLTTEPTKYRLEVPSRFTTEDPEVVEGVMCGGYPHIGTLAEMGISIIEHKLLIVLSKNPTVTKHPFVRAGATRILSSLDDGIEYLQGTVGVLLGSNNNT